MKTNPARALRALLVLLVIWPLVPEASAQNVPGGRPAVAASKRAGALVIDGRLDEADWAAAAPATDFVQQKPVERAAAEHRTEVRFLFDEDALYIGARMLDSEPQTIARQLYRRDETGNADVIGVGFDPRLDRRTAYVFYVSAANVQRDFYIYNDNQIDGAWDAVWESAVQIDALGWTAEIRIPLSQLRYETAAAAQTWGMNIARERVNSNEETHFSLMSATYSGYVSQFALLTGLDLPRAARRVEMRPYVVSGSESRRAVPGDPFHDGSEPIQRVGADLRYGLGSSFTLDATINPDFGQVEADPAVVNLTAFESFFSERRPFFVEDARIFDFSLSGMTNQLFYGRRIGRSPRGAPPDSAAFSDLPDAARILGAAKLTGRTSRGLALGAIIAVTDDVRGRAHFTPSGQTRSFLAEPGAVQGALRARQEFREGATTIGAIATLQDRHLPNDGSFDYLTSSAVTGGVDWEHLWADRTYGFTGYIAGSHVRGDSTAMIRIQRSSVHYLQRPDSRRYGVDSSATSLSGVDWRFTVAKRNGEHWTGSVWAAEVTPTFEVNDLGFSSRQEVLDAGARISYREITPGPRFRNYELQLTTFHNWSHEALDQPWSARSWGESHVAGALWLRAEAQLLNYWNLNGSVSYRPEMVDRNGTRGGPRMLLPRSHEIGFGLETDDRRAIAFEPEVEFERKTLGAGARDEFSFGIRLRPSSRVEATVEPRFARVRHGAQFVGTSGALPYAPTFGTRYLFGELEQRELGVETRLDFTFSPRMTLQLYVQPLISAGDFRAYKQLSAPRTFTFDQFAEGTFSAGACSGGRTCEAPDGTRYVDFDGDGTADHSFRDRDFNLRSLIGNAVFRWEFRPGSALFVVWQRQQEEENAFGSFDVSRDARGLFRAPARNVLLLKMSFWTGF